MTEPDFPYECIACGHGEYSATSRSGCSNCGSQDEIVPRRSAAGKSDFESEFKDAVVAIEQARKTMQAAQRRLDAFTKEPRRCSVCGGTEDGPSYLTEFEVIVAPREEGYQNVRMFRCEEHLDEVVGGLFALGFRTHEHGSTALLEDAECPGSDRPGSCPTPTAYGAVTITDTGFWQHPDVIAAAQ